MKEKMKKLMQMILFVLIALELQLPVLAAAVPGQGPDGAEAFSVEEGLDALGRGELMEQVPEGARELMEETGVYDISTENLLGLSPANFFRTLWRLFVGQVKKPVRVLATVTGIVILCALLGGMQDAAGQNTLTPVFSTVSVLCVLGSVAVPILDCIVDTSRAIQQASTFMLNFIPIFSAALTASGQPITGATYNMFLFATCQVVSQVVSRTLIPLMGVYLAFCIVGPVAPNMKISSATSAVKSLVNWALGFILTIFVGLLSIQTMVAHSADSVGTRTAKFLIGSFVPVVGGALSDAYVAAQGCLRLIKTTLGAYGIVVAALTFLPILLQTVIWFLLTKLAVIGSDLMGVSQVSEILKSCGSVLSILIAVIFCFILLIIVSTTVVMVIGMGGT